MSGYFAWVSELDGVRSSENSSCDYGEVGPDLPCKYHLDSRAEIHVVDVDLVVSVEVVDSATAYERNDLVSVVCSG